MWTARVPYVPIPSAPFGKLRAARMTQLISSVRGMPRMWPPEAGDRKNPGGVWRLRCSVRECGISKIASAAVVLASDESAFTVGSELIIDGVCACKEKDFTAGFQ